jgi:hypothetical protein
MWETRNPLAMACLNCGLPLAPDTEIYYMWKGDRLILLLLGGDKGSQARDIAQAKMLAKEADDGFEDTPL